MYLASKTRRLALLAWCCFLATSQNVKAAESKEPGLFEIDLFFPRNDSYAPSAFMPFVFGFKGSELASYLPFTVNMNVTRDNAIYINNDFDFVAGSNFSSIQSTFRTITRNFTEEGTWVVDWSLRWYNCTVDAKTGRERNKGSLANFTFTFTTKNGSQPVDLVAEAKKNACSLGQTYSFNLSAVQDTCVTVSKAMPISESCQIEMPAADAAKINDMVASMECKADNPPLRCSTGGDDSSTGNSSSTNQTDSSNEESSGQQFAIGGTTGWALVLGGLFYALS